MSGATGVRPWSRLTVRILLMALAVIAVTVGATAAFARWGTTVQVSRDVEQSADTAALISEISAGAVDGPSIAGSEGQVPVITGTAILPGPEATMPGLDAAVLKQISDEAGTAAQVIVVGPDGRVVDDSSGALVGQEAARLAFTPAIGDAIVPLDRGGFMYVASSGTVTSPASPTGSGGADSERAAASLSSDLVSSVTLFSLVGGLAAALVAVGLAVVVGRRMLRPVRELSSAARRIESGDTTVRYQGNDRSELGELGAAFNTMAERLERDERLRSAMVTDVAHELRTPLGNLRGYLEALADGVVAPEPELLSSLHEETLHLSRLVDDLQELSLLEAGALRLAEESVDVPALARQVVGAAALEASERGVELVVEVDDELAPIRGDGQRLAQVVRNLVTNAVRHTPPGGRVVVRAIVADGATAIEVADTGVGMSRDEMDHMFERFWRSDASRQRATGGSGLGLAIVARLVEAHGGTVAARSAGPGQGTTVRVEVPSPAAVPG